MQLPRPVRGLLAEDIGLFEPNEPFAAGADLEVRRRRRTNDPRLSLHGGDIACGHPPAATGRDLVAELAYGFEQRPDARCRPINLCIGDEDGRRAPVGEHTP